MKAHFLLTIIFSAALLQLAGCLGVTGEPLASESPLSPPTPTAFSTPAPSETLTTTVEITATAIAITTSIDSASPLTVTVEAEETLTDTVGISEEQARLVRAVEDVPEINPYRTQIEVDSVGSWGHVNIQAELAYVKDPYAEWLLGIYLQEDLPFEFETIHVDGISYTRMMGPWIRADALPIAYVLINGVTVVPPQNIADVVEQMEVIGIERIKGAMATHYRGDKEIIRLVGNESEHIDLNNIEDGQIDIWVDKSYNAIIRLTAGVSSNEPPITATLSFEYSDLNGDIEIVAPDMIGQSDEPSAEGEFVPINELGVLLGFNLQFPEDSTIEMVIGTQHYTIVTSYTFEETEEIVIREMEANGYSQSSRTNLSGERVIYQYYKDNKRVIIVLEEVGANRTRLKFSLG